MRLQSLHLHTHTPDALFHFYQNVLQCNVEAADNGFFIRAGTTQIYFQKAEESQPVYHFAFTIPWNQIAEALVWTSARVEILPLENGQQLADFKNWNAKAFYFFDPAGNIVEFIARAPLGIESSTPFSGSSLASLSEIGIVTDDVALTCRQLQELWQVPLFSKQPPMPQFAAAGDDEGLFIVVQEDRPWYPTQTPATKAPLKAVFQTDDRTVRTLEIS